MLGLYEHMGILLIRVLHETRTVADSAHGRERVPMGKLAERLGDAQRSGVYRVEATDALEEAAAVNGFALARVELQGASGNALCGLCARVLAPGVDGSWRGLASALADSSWSPAPGHVLLFSGFETLVRGAPDALHPLLSALDAAASRRRAEGLPFFAAFLDPARVLSLGPLYNWQRQASHNF